MNSPSTTIEVPGYESINDSWGGLVTGLGLDLKALTFDVEYQFGLINAYREQKDSKINSLSITLGFFF